MDRFKPNQLAALKKLEAALLSVKRAGLVLAGSDDSLLATVEDDEFIDAVNRDSTCEAMRDRFNSHHPLAHSVKHYGLPRQRRCIGHALVASQDVTTDVVEGGCMLQVSLRSYFDVNTMVGKAD